MANRAVVLSRHQSDCGLLQRQDKMSDSGRTRTGGVVSVSEEVKIFTMQFGFLSLHYFAMEFHNQLWED